MSIDSINHLWVNYTSNATTGSVLTTTDGNHLIQNVDLSYRQGYRKNYSIRDAAASLWRQEPQTVNLKGLEEPEKTTGIVENVDIQSKWDKEPNRYAGEVEDEVILQYIQDLRQNGLKGTVNWSNLSREFETFKAIAPWELNDGLNYLASRYVAVLDKLERNYDGKELALQCTKLEVVYQTGRNEMIDGYARLLQDCLGISSSDVQVVKDSLSAILTEKVDAYRDTLGIVNEIISQTGPDSVWLKNHDAYIAFQLRVTRTVEESKTPYSIQDLTLAGQLAHSYPMSAT